MKRAVEIRVSQGQLKNGLRGNWSFSDILSGVAAFLAASIWPGCGASLLWHPAAGPLMTRWAAEVSPTNAHPEYPRPQLVRADWMNLNGIWDYAITPATVERVTNYEGPILVPFPVESALSGVMRRLDENSTLWYRKSFEIPTGWSGRRVRLHFGAVDWRAKVFINGEEAGQHRGGYDGFSFDVTAHLKWSGQEEIVVAVSDPTEGDQPRGKQSRKPEGIFYTPSSGIWQTVWLEPVPKICIDGLALMPDEHTLRLKVAANSLAESVQVEVVASATGKEIGRVRGPASKELNLPIGSPRLWSPEDPFLYDLSVTLEESNHVLDKVTSYFGMRKMALKKDNDGLTRMALNGQFTFQLGTLDQGFWPDGLYASPTDEALRSDLEFLKAAGFNLVRKHVKVEPDRWYYWCDKLGLLVWQDMPSGNNTTPEGRTQFEAELQSMVEGRGNHPSIIVWVLFNEGWGQYDTERLVPWLKSLDPSRLIDNASGWTDNRVGDLVDNHSYPGPESSQPESERAAVIGEFGGLGFGMNGHMWSEKFWGYQRMADAVMLAAGYNQLLEQVHILHEAFGLSAAVYTQTTDVETECNGLLTYDRAVSKISPASARAANRGEHRPPARRVIVPDALHSRVSWRYVTEMPGTNWSRSGFDDSGWKEGLSGFGTQGTPGALVRTTWKSADIWLRREFVLNHEDRRGAKIQIHHDEDAEIYFNGVLATQVPGFSTNYYELEINAEAAATLKPGVNLLAAHCHQTGGGQYIDVGIVAPQPIASSDAKK